ncbi:Uncharacterised protein [Mycobacteroides abscessus]|nr:Uncharacterised protein [Mycobacteroides abscessus]
MSGVTVTWADAAAAPVTTSPVVSAAAPTARRVFRMVVPFGERCGERGRCSGGHDGAPRHGSAEPAGGG